MNSRKKIVAGLTALLLGTSLSYILAEIHSKNPLTDSQVYVNRQSSESNPRLSQPANSRDSLTHWSNNYSIQYRIAKAVSIYKGYTKVEKKDSYYKTYKVENSANLNFEDCAFWKAAEESDKNNDGEVEESEASEFYMNALEDVVNGQITHEQTEKYTACEEVDTNQDKEILGFPLMMLDLYREIEDSEDVAEPSQSRQLERLFRERANLQRGKEESPAGGERNPYSIIENNLFGNNQYGRNTLPSTRQQNGRNNRSSNYSIGKSPLGLY